MSVKQMSLYQQSNIYLHETEWTDLRPLEARKWGNLHVVLKTQRFKQRFCTSHGRGLVRTPHNYGGVVTNRLEKGTLMTERVLKIPFFLTSSGKPTVVRSSFFPSFFFITLKPSVE